MKNKTKLFTVVCILVLASCKKPMDYYNQAVSAGNLSISLHEMESRIERIQEGFELQPMNLAARTSMRVQANEGQLERIQEFLGNSESDPMMKAAIAYLENDIASAKNPKTIEILNAIDKQLNLEDLEKALEPYETYLDTMYDKKEELWQTYNTEVSKYAKAHDIKEQFYGPNLQPIEEANE